MFIPSLFTTKSTQPCCRERTRKRGLLFFRKSPPSPCVSMTTEAIDKSVAKCATIVGGRCVPFESHDVVRLKRLRKLWQTLSPVDESWCSRSHQGRRGVPTTLELCEDCQGHQFTKSAPDVTVLVTDVALTYYKPPTAHYGCHMQVLRALSTMGVEAFFQDRLFGDAPPSPTPLITSTCLPSPSPLMTPRGGGGTREDKLFDLFTTYAMLITCEDPTSIRMGYVIKMLQDCQVVIDSVATSSASTIDPLHAPHCLNQVRGTYSIFKGYADATHRTTASHRNKLKAKTHAVHGGVNAPTTTAKKKACPLLHHMAMYLNYHDSVAFARQFGLVSHGGVTIAEFAAAYIDSVEKAKGSTRRQLTFLGFCHLLLRLALKLYSHAPVSVSVQLKYVLFSEIYIMSSI
ncbi:hypothetical protein DYB38_012691 [Aphanomyces astaci]|uniref:Uncharacterized protein n=1 Tax=Aphanomyces astaci TaxID=112090 RepID=A0A397DWB3_APHAT|nr:hypothetical protein DYB38_012691 [Aphanomyces astaci]